MPQRSPAIACVSFWWSRKALRAGPSSKPSLSTYKGSEWTVNTIEHETSPPRDGMHLCSESWGIMNKYINKH